MAKNPLLEDVWPQERDVFVRPERLKYVRKIIKPKTCVFCDCAKVAEKKRPEKLVLYRSKHAMVVMNKYPYNNGHLLVLPCKHLGQLEDLSDKEYAEIGDLLRQCVKILKKNYTCAGFNIGMNLSAAAGAGIPDHLHWHIIPRWFGDTNFFPLIAETKLIVETLETTYQKLAKDFKKLEGKKS